MTDTALLGHDEAMRQVAEAYASGRMHHAWLITGPEGIGKTTLATHIAHHVLSNGENALGAISLQGRVARLIHEESHPDMMILRRGVNEKGETKNEITAKEAREVAPFLHLTAALGGWRVVIVDEAHRLNRHGQNAILKILEEPPKRALILITVTTAGALLPTIRSRCRVLALAPLEDHAMQTILQKKKPDLTDAETARLIALSGGSIGFALRLLNSEALEYFDELLKIVDGLPEMDIPRLHKLADGINRKGDAERFEVLSSLFLDHLRQKAVDLAHANANRYAVDRALTQWEKTQTLLETAAYGNLDKKLAFINAVSGLRE